MDFWGPANKWEFLGPGDFQNFQASLASTSVSYVPTSLKHVMVPLRGILHPFRMQQDIARAGGEGGGSAP